MGEDRQVTCVGDLMIECMMEVPALPAQNETIIVDAVRQQLGGNAFNICWYLRHLGHRPFLVGLYGVRNRALVDAMLQSADLDRNGLVEVEGDTDYLLAMLTRNHHHSIYMRAALPPDIALRLMALCKTADFLVLAGSRHADIRSAQSRLADSFAGNWLTFTPSYAVTEYPQRELAALVAMSHLVILNEQEARYACTCLGIHSFQQLAGVCREILIVTLAERGAELYERGRMSHVGTFASSTADVIGTGDAFLGAFLDQWLRGRTAVQSAEFGAALASFVVETGSVRVSVTEKDVQDRLANPLLRREIPVEANT